MKTKIRLLTMFCCTLLVLTAILYACTPSDAGKLGAAPSQRVNVSALFGADAGIGAVPVMGEGGYYPSAATVSTSLTAGGDCVGTTGALACKQAAGSDGGFTVNATWLGHLAAVGNGRLEAVAKCSSLGSICTMTVPVPANTHGKVVVEVSGATGDGGLAVATQTFTGYVSNSGGTCKAYGLAIAGGTLYATDSGAAGAWVPTVSLSSCSLLVKGTNGTDAGTTIDWAATVTMFPTH
jgi:hypothetical protein